MTSKIAASTYAAIGMSVSGGCSGLPDHPRSPLNVRPFSVRVGRTENFLIVTPRGRCPRVGAGSTNRAGEREELLTRAAVLAQEAMDRRRDGARAAGLDAAQ